MKLAIVVSHVIQYFCPQYVSWAQNPDVEIKVFFGSKQGLGAYFDDQFQRSVQWEGLDLSFPHAFLPGADTRGIIANDCEALDEALAAYGADAVLVYGWDLPLTRRAMRWAKRNGAFLLLLSDAEMRSAVPLWKLLAKEVITRRTLLNYDFYLTVGDANEAFYRHYGADDRQFIRGSFPIDINLFDEVLAQRDAHRAAVREALGIPTHHKVLLNVGKLVPWKRPEDLVALSNRLQGKRNDVTVVLVGSGEMDASLRAATNRVGAGGVVYAGFVQPQELAAYYVASDLYCVTASRERHSLSVSEAIHVGLPVVTSDRCGSYGPTDAVRPGVNGLVFPCGDLDQLEALVTSLFDNEARYRAFSAASQSIGFARQDLAHRGWLTSAAVLMQSAWAA